MIYLLDTNEISAVKRLDRPLRVAAWLRHRAESELSPRVVTLGEIERVLCAQERTNPSFAAELRLWLDRRRGFSLTASCLSAPMRP